MCWFSSFTWSIKIKRISNWTEKSRRNLLSQQFLTNIISYARIEKNYLRSPTMRNYLHLFRKIIFKQNPISYKQQNIISYLAFKNCSLKWVFVILIQFKPIISIKPLDGREKNTFSNKIWQKLWKLFLTQWKGLFLELSINLQWEVFSSIFICYLRGTTCRYKSCQACSVRTEK